MRDHLAVLGVGAALGLLEAGFDAELAYLIGGQDAEELVAGRVERDAVHHENGFNRLQVFVLGEHDAGLGAQGDALGLRDVGGHEEGLAGGLGVGFQEDVVGGLLELEGRVVGAVEDEVGGVRGAVVCGVRRRRRLRGGGAHP